MERFDTCGMVRRRILCWSLTCFTHHQNCVERPPRRHAEEGFINPRADILASNGFVISDEVDGMDKLLTTALWSTRL
jgi:hypothetical protein